MLMWMREWEEPALEHRSLRKHLELGRSGENRCLGGRKEGWKGGREEERVLQMQSQASFNNLVLSIRARTLTVEAALLLDFGQSAEEIYGTHVYLGKKVYQ